MTTGAGEVELKEETKTVKSITVKQSKKIP